MTTEITVAAVGDILMWGKQISFAKNRAGYSFDSMFRQVSSYLRSADLTIGNLETTLSGREKKYQKKNPRNGFPMFNCPDELAAALKKSGFDVLTTANNHCMDRGEKGLKRTLNILDRHGISHTGTFRSQKEAKRFLIKEKKGIKVGILAYTYGTNGIAVPSSKPWLVNRIRRAKMLKDLHDLRKKADIIIVALHFGREFHRYPSEKQKSIAQLLLQNGADVILGAHPHVIQPMVQNNGKFVIYSLGNFISARMRNNLHTESGVRIRKEEDGNTVVSSVSYIPTWTQQESANGKKRYRVLPVRKFLRHPDSHLSKNQLETMRKVWRNTTNHLKETPQ
jgi:poly-gamma-glutamate synthesis protein (capsule biosynthesis protein)